MESTIDDTATELACACPLRGSHASHILAIHRFNPASLHTGHNLGPANGACFLDTGVSSPAFRQLQLPFAASHGGEAVLHSFSILATYTFSKA